MVMSAKKAKEHCGYVAKPERQTCSNCGAYRSSMEYPSWVGRDEGTMTEAEYDQYGYSKREKKIHCVDHGFAVKKTATCDLWRKTGEQT